MGKKTRLFISASVIMLVACSQENKVDSKNVEYLSTKKLLKTENSPTSSTIKTIPKGTISNGEYFFSFNNDTICQQIKLKKIGRLDKDGIAAKLQFELLLNDKLRLLNKKIEGVASLASIEESFTDRSGDEDADYLASDYIYDSKYLKLKIRIDIENYEACVISLESNSTNSDLGKIIENLKKYPNYDVMKVGKCR